MDRDVNYSNFDAIIERVFEVTGIESQTELARVLQINRSAVTQARKKGSVPDRWLLQLYRKFGLNPEWLESGDGRAFLRKSRNESVVEFKQIPKVMARLCTGDGSFESDADIQCYYAFQKDWLRQKGNLDSMVLFDIFGNSMEPEIRNGDTVLIDQSQKAILAGAMYAVGIEDTIMVKRIEKRPNKLVLLSNHKDYLPVMLTREEANAVRIIGKVVWICREI
jgi:phage repressor protein C with HTH and peptisase S24 domain